MTDRETENHKCIQCGYDIVDSSNYAVEKVADETVVRTHKVCPSER